MIATFLFFIGIGLVILFTMEKPIKKSKKKHGWDEHIKRAQGR